MPWTEPCPKIDVVTSRESGNMLKMNLKLSRAFRPLSKTPLEIHGCGR